MDSWKCKNRIAHFKKFDIFYLFHLIVEKLDVFNFHPFFFLILSIISHSLARFEHVFFFLIYYKSGNITEKKNKTLKDFHYFLISKCRQNQIKLELSEEIMVMWREKQSPEVFCEKGILRNFAKLTGKHLCQSLFFNKAAGLSKFIRTRFLT